MILIDAGFLLPGFNFNPTGFTVLVEAGETIRQPLPLVSRQFAVIDQRLDRIGQADAGIASQLAAGCEIRAVRWPGTVDNALVALVGLDAAPFAAGTKAQRQSPVVIGRHSFI